MASAVSLSHQICLCFEGLGSEGLVNLLELPCVVLGKYTQFTPALSPRVCQVAALPPTLSVNKSLMQILPLPSNHLTSRRKGPTCCDFGFANHSVAAAQEATY